MTPKQAKLVKFLLDTDQHLDRVVNSTVREVSQRLKGLASGDLSLLSDVRRLSVGWTRRKGHGDVLRNKGDYLKSIKVSGKASRFRIWTKQKALAGYLEFGTKHMEAIPHWRYIRLFTIYTFRKFMFVYLRKLQRALSGH